MIMALVSWVCLTFVMAHSCSQYIDNVKRLLRYKGPDISKIMCSCRSSAVSKLQAASSTAATRPDLMCGLRMLGTRHDSDSDCDSDTQPRSPSHTISVGDLKAEVGSWSQEHVETRSSIDPEVVFPPHALEALQAALRRYLIGRRGAARMKRQRAQVMQSFSLVRASFGTQAHSGGGMAPWRREFEITFHDLTYEKGCVPAVSGVMIVLRAMCLRQVPRGRLDLHQCRHRPSVPWSADRYSRP